MHEANVIAVFNRKGGVGKTSLCFHLSGAWASQGRRVLCLDMDPQASLSQAFLGSVALIPHEQTLASLFDGTTIDLFGETTAHGIDVIASGSDLGMYNLTDPQSRAEQDLVAIAVNEFRLHYDVILIDCPPCLQLCSWASLLAADSVLVPVIPSNPGVEGLTHVHQMISQAKSRLNPRLTLLGYVLSMVSRNALHKSYSEMLRAQHPGQVLRTEVPRGTLFEQAITSRTPVSLHRPKSAAAKIIQELAREIDSRVAMGRAA